MSWKEQELAKDCKEIICEPFDATKDYVVDPSGYYVLIRLDFHQLNIEVGVCDNNHNIIAIFKGRKAQDVYLAIFQYEKDNSIEFFKSKDHIAYLGKELKKAEIALVLGNESYFQE